MIRKRSSVQTTTSEALLGVLSLGAMSGYQMRGLIDRSIGNFWSESYGQIYPTLRKLSEAGMVKMTRTEADGRPDSKTYTLTEAGRDHVQRWLGSPSHPQVPRNELLLKIFFGNLVPIHVVREQIAAFRALQLGLLTHYDATEQQLLREKADDPRLPFWRMTLDYGIEESRGLLRWAERSLALCDGLEETQQFQDGAEAPESAQQAAQ